jgi:hypothetical protein
VLQCICSRHVCIPTCIPTCLYPPRILLTMLTLQFRTLRWVQRASTLPGLRKLRTAMLAHTVLHIYHADWE